MPGAAREPLSPLESRVMEIVWKRGAATADDVGQDLGDRMTNASVRTLLRRIEAKGFITHVVRGRTFVYEPRIDAPTAARSAVRRVLDRFYGGSVEALVLGLLDGRLMDRRQLNRLADKVARADRPRRKDAAR
jgi:predicted transcriptional regulator